jgi:hypothetical protein
MIRVIPAAAALSFFLCTGASALTAVPKLQIMAAQSDLVQIADRHKRDWRRSEHRRKHHYRHHRHYRHHYRHPPD